MPYSQLLSILRPSEAPIETGSDSAWATVETMLNTTLPEDYKQFIDNFGSGWVGGFLYLYNPFSSKAYMNWFNNLDIVTGLAESLGQGGHPLNFGSGSLIPFGATKDGHTLFWLTNGLPEQWTIFILDARAPLFDAYDTDLTGFLYKLLKCEIDGKTLHSTSLELFTVGDSN